MHDNGYMSLYAVHNPSTYDLSELIGRGSESPTDIAKYLSSAETNGIDGQQDITRKELAPLLRFNDGKRKIGVGEAWGVGSHAQYYVAQQIANLEDEARVALTDCVKKPLADVVEACDAVFITSMSSNFPTAVAMAVLLNRARIPVVLGGIHVSGSMQDVDTYVREHVEHPELVAAVDGAGDTEVIREILSGIHDDNLKKTYEGSVTTEDGVWGNDRVDRVEPMRMQFLSKVPILGDWVKRNMAMTPIAPHLGCPFSCDFCSTGGIDGKKRRVQKRGHDDLIEELHAVQANGGRAIMFQPDNLLLDKRYLNEMLDRIIESDLRINYAAQISIEVADNPELLKKLRQSGATHLFIGFETLDIRNLKHVNKHCVGAIEKSEKSVEEYYSEKIKLIQKHGISVQFAGIVGLPFDRFDSLQDHTGRDIAEFCKRNKIGMQLTPLGDLPGSRQHARSVEEGTHLYGKPGSMDYLYGLSFADLTESNRIPHKSLHSSPLVASYMAYDGAREANKRSAALRNGFHMARKAIQSPVRNKSRRIGDKLFNDPLFAFGAQIIVSQYAEIADGIYLPRGDMQGTLKRLYEREKEHGSPEVVEMFKEFVESI